jgi:bifunctional non-homologous end joining protein LigD
VPSARSRSCFIDGEVIVVNERGLSVFDLIRSGRRDRDAVLCAFDLIELDGRDLRGAPIEERKHVLANLLFREGDGISFNDLYDGDGAMIFKQACALGCEGIVSKRLGSPYRSGPFNDWLKIKNPAAPAVQREAEEDWARKRRRQITPARSPRTDRARGDV